MKYPRSETGEVKIIKLKSGRLCYARILPKMFEFFNVCSELSLSCENIDVSNVAFVAGVHKSALRRWKTICRTDIDDVVMRDHCFFKINHDTRSVEIYKSKSSSENGYEIFRSSHSECLGLDPLLAWDPDQIEERLEDFFSERENRYISFYRKKLVSILN